MNTRTIAATFAVCAAATVALFGAVRIARADDRVTQTRSVPTFDRVRLEGAFRTDVTANAAGVHVSVAGDRSDVERVTTRVEAGTLVVGMRSGTWRPGASDIDIAVAAPALRGLENSGAGNIAIRGLHGDAFALENSGTATIVARGRVARATISVAGVGNIDTSGLEARDVTVDNDGVASLRVRATGTLTATVNGVGAVRYAGNPAHVEKTVNGLGRIEPM